MKILSSIFTLCLFSTLSFAQSYSMSGSGATTLTCDLSREHPSSKRFTEITKAKTSVKHCLDGNQNTYELIFINLEMKENDESTKQLVKLRCTGEETEGQYLFGGNPIGFTQKNSVKAPWFYKVGKSSAGRCSLEYNPATLSLNAIMNKSAMLLLKLN